MEQNKRKHMCSMIRNQFEDTTTGPVAALGSNFYVKKVLGKAKYFRRFDKNRASSLHTKALFFKCKNQKNIK